MIDLKKCTITHGPSGLIYVTATCRDCKNTIKNIPVMLSHWQLWRQGKTIQEVMPYLTTYQREILISEYCGTCFDRIFGDPKQ